MRFPIPAEQESGEAALLLIIKPGVRSRHLVDLAVTGGLFQRYPFLA